MQINAKLTTNQAFCGNYLGSRRTMLDNRADSDCNNTMIVVLVRHLAASIGAHICYGRTDMPLRPDSLADVPRLAAEICAHGIGRVWTSPAARCRVLADAI